MSDLLTQMQQLVMVLFKPEELMKILGQPEFLVAGFILLNIIIFTETGLLIGFFLPGDSLLVTVGVVFYNLINVQGCSFWILPGILATLSVSAVVGDSVGYTIGRRTGPKIFSREKSFLFRKDHLLAAQAYYEKHGGKTIVIARFIPILRTFAPVVAGVGKMDYKRFVTYNVVGGVSWIFSMILLGFALTPVLNPLLRPIFGDEFRVDKHIEKVIILVVLVSISPGIFAWLRSKLRKRKPEGPAPESVAAPSAVESIPTAP